MQDPSDSSPQAVQPDKKKSFFTPNVIIIVILFGFGGVIFLGGIVAALVIPAAHSAHNQAKLTQEMSYGRQLANLIVTCEQKEGQRPRSLDELAQADFIDRDSFDVVAIDPETGEERWHYFPRVDDNYSPLLLSKKIFSGGGTPIRLMVRPDSSAMPIPVEEAAKYLQETEE